MHSVKDDHWNRPVPRGQCAAPASRLYLGCGDQVGGDDCARLRTENEKKNRDRNRERGERDEDSGEIQRDGVSAGGTDGTSPTTRQPNFGQSRTSWVGVVEGDIGMISIGTAAKF